MGIGAPRTSREMAENPSQGVAKGGTLTRAETQLKLPTSLRSMSQGPKTLPPEKTNGQRKTFIFQDSNSRALSLRTRPSALGPVWLAPSHEVSPDPNMSMKESEDGGRWDRGDQGESLENWTLTRKAGPFLKAGFRLFLTPLIPRSDEAKYKQVPLCWISWEYQRTLGR